MKKAWMYLILLVCALIPGCRSREGYEHFQLVRETITQNSEPSYLWTFGDLKGDGYEHYILASQSTPKQNYILVKDQSGRAISQLNYRHRIRNVNVLRDPVSREPWLFHGFNDQEHVFLNGVRYTWINTLQREDRKYSPIARLEDEPQGFIDSEWNGAIYPSFIEDIDGDGNQELVCRTADSFRANPRGLAVYDFESGKLKWRFDLSTYLSSVLFDDFDGDGTKEFICGNSAFKNTREIKQGMDDNHGWLMVLSTEGELLYHEKVFDDFGELWLASDDVDQDGTPEIIAAQGTWGSTYNPDVATRFSWNGREMVRDIYREFPLNFGQNLNKYFYSVLDGTGTKRFLLPAADGPLIVLDENFQEIRHGFRDIVRCIWDIEDIDRDGSKEILLQTTANKFVVLDKNLIKTAELENPFSDKNPCSAYIVQTGRYSDCRVAICSPGEVRYYSYERISPFQALAGYFDDLATYLLILVTLLLILLLIVFNHRNQVLSTAIDHFPLGIIIMASRNRITHINRYMLETLQENTRIPALKKARKLNTIMPELQSILVGFVRNKALEFSTSINLGKSQARHEVHMHKLHGLSRRYLIVLKPETPASENLEAKLNWADTARRLSHNVRRHITNVLLALKPLEENGQSASGPEYREYAQIIRKEIEKIRVFTHAFQRFSELKEYDLKMQDVIPSVEHCVNHARIPSNVKLIRNWPDRSIEALTEPLRFEEALSNILNNALESMPDGGTLQVSVKSFPGHTSPGGRLSVLIEVEDSGRGISKDQMDEIWQLYYTTKESGTGIGLPEARKIIESMGGSIDIQSEPGMGTVVSLWLKGESDG